ncbi:hypothetical protein Lalb_Chr03g0039561 [Lupinus albus]|uniref:Uncharacterized protein n=1 Tax=Lupinus albus TaxID=3870 RepID=A0A6A4QX49_LUPAL|nr:hypothetical protein Lalb_Chr03g0039561 [Lupinus albus]
MALMAFSSTLCKFNIHIIKHKIGPFFYGVKLYDQIKPRELILRSGKLATIGSIVSILNLSGEKPDYLGVQKNQESLALCPGSNNCISTSENVADIMHYAPPWSYNPEDRKDRVSKEEAILELIDVIESTIPPENFIPRIVERTEDYIRVEYESPILGVCV